MLASNKMRFLLKTLIISLIFVGIFSIKTLAIVKPTSEFYVNDYANLLNTETKNYIMNTNISLQNKTGAQIVVVTVPNLEGKALEEYATEFFREFGIGDKNKNNGVLLLLALEERQFRVEVGYGLEGILPDGKTGRIQDEYIIPYLKQNNWNEGIKNGFSAILKEIEKEYSIDVGSEDAVSSVNENNDGGIITTIMGFPVISAVMGAIIRNISLKKNKKVIISILYMVITSIVYYVSFRAIGVTEDIREIIIFIIFNYVWFIVALFGKVRGGGYYGGRWIFKRRWLL